MHPLNPPLVYLSMTPCLLDSPLIDVLICFRFHRIALSADVSKMYRTIKLVPADKDIHRFVWKEKGSQGVVKGLPHDKDHLWSVSFDPHLLQTCR